MFQHYISYVYIDMIIYYISYICILCARTLKTQVANFLTFQLAEHDSLLVCQSCVNIGKYNLPHCSSIIFMCFDRNGIGN